MSEPARIGTWRSATALVRVKRGSTWTSFAPLSLAFMGQRNATGWHSAMFEPTPELLAHVVELAVQGRAAEPEDGRSHVHELAVGELLDERLVAGLLDQLGHPVHRPLELDHLPIAGTGLAVQHLGGPVRVHVQLVDRRALGAEGALVVRAARVAFDVDDLAVDGVDQGGAPDRAERADARGGLGVLDPQLLRPRRGWRQRHAEPDQPADCRSRAGAGGEPQEITSTDLHTVPPRSRWGWGARSFPADCPDDIETGFRERNPGFPPLPAPRNHDGLRVWRHPRPGPSVR